MAPKGSIDHVVTTGSHTDMHTGQDHNHSITYMAVPDPNNPGMSIAVPANGTVHQLSAEQIHQIIHNEVQRAVAYLVGELQLACETIDDLEAELTVAENEWNFNSNIKPKRRGNF